MTSSTSASARSVPRSGGRRLSRLPAPLWLVSACEDDRDATLAAWPSRPGGLLLLPCGVCWDAVRLPAQLGLAVLDALLHDAVETGPVLHDCDTQVVYVLITPGGGIDWNERHPQVRLLSTGCYLATPSPELDWLNRMVVWAHMPPLPAPTDPADLLAALDGVTKSRTSTAA
ncbi:hypothetical protein [Kitasatospora aureofaciens]|uniref:hypothetical protein n=1 Tax=Kitasatospora aureofaciens TaxID=1894 RepID=UPI001C44E6BA|nr:hypothetical protein [Kitasatospora aureofaciens]MBV6699396.1 hypothetical protein [Kitasatospora aureofaciens]